MGTRDRQNNRSRHLKIECVHRIVLVVLVGPFADHVHVVPSTTIALLLDDLILPIDAKCILHHSRLDMPVER